MRLTVKNYKRAEWASEETDCFSASLYLDGKRIGTARNDGRGGCDFLDFESREKETAFREYVSEWIESIQDDQRFQIDGRCYADADSLVAEACDVFRREKEMKRRAKGYASVIRIERQRGYAVEIMEWSLPDGFDQSEIIAGDHEDGDRVFVYEIGASVVEIIR